MKYGYHHRTNKNLRKGKCSDCGNLFLINTKRVTCNFTTEYRFGNRVWGAYKGDSPQAFIYLRSYCCRALMAPTRIEVGTEIHGVIE
jgi:hypothetical protein